MNKDFNNVEEVYFSVDIEADGKTPGKYSMSSIGVSAAAYRTKSSEYVQLDADAPEHCFYAELKPISDEWNEAAAAVAGIDREDLIINGLEPTEAMDQLIDFVNTVTAAYGSNTRAVFVAWPLSFDWMFTYWYLCMFSERPSPFGFSSALDIKTLFAQKANMPIRRVNKRAIPAALRSKRKHTHNALDDAKEQGELFFNISTWKP